MIGHTSVNTHKQEFQCTHCGVTAKITPGLLSEFEEQITKFNEAHNLCPVPVFKPGDKVVFCGETATVVSNHGDSGTVEIPGQGRMNWYWSFQGERVMPVNNGGK